MGCQRKPRIVQGLPPSDTKKHHAVTDQLVNPVCARRCSESIASRVVLRSAPARSRQPTPSSAHLHAAKTESGDYIRRTHRWAFGVVKHLLIRNHARVDSICVVG